MLILTLAIGLIGGLLAGGRITNLANVRLRLVWLLFLGLVVRYATQFAIEAGVPFVDQLRLPLFAGGFLLLLIALWANREQPGLPLAFVGILLNATAIVTNGGYMPVRLDDLARAGFPQNAAKIIRDGHYEKSTALTEATLLPWLGDVIYLPLPYGPGRMISIGDVFVAAGTFLFIQEALVPSRRRTPTLRAAPAAS